MLRAQTLRLVFLENKLGKIAPVTIDQKLDGWINYPLSQICHRNTLTNN